MRFKVLHLLDYKAAQTSAHAQLEGLKSPVAWVVVITFSASAWWVLT